LEGRQLNRQITTNKSQHRVHDSHQTNILWLKNLSSYWRRVAPECISPWSATMRRRRSSALANTKKCICYEQKTEDVSINAATATGARRRIPQHTCVRDTARSRFARVLFCSAWTLIINSKFKIQNFHIVRLLPPGVSHTTRIVFRLKIFLGGSPVTIYMFRSPREL